MLKGTEGEDSQRKEITVMLVKVREKSQKGPLKESTQTRNTRREQRLSQEIKDRDQEIFLGLRKKDKRY